MNLALWRCAGRLDDSGKKASCRNIGFGASLNKRQQNREEQQESYTDHHLLAGRPNGIFFRFYKVAGRVIILKRHLLGSRGMLVYIRHNKKSTAEHNACKQRDNCSSGIIAKQICLQIIFQPELSIPHKRGIRYTAKKARQVSACRITILQSLCQKTQT